MKKSFDSNCFHFSTKMNWLQLLHSRKLLNQLSHYFDLLFYASMHPKFSPLDLFHHFLVEAYLVFYSFSISKEWKNKFSVFKWNFAPNSLIKKLFTAEDEKKGLGALVIFVSERERERKAKRWRRGEGTQRDKKHLKIHYTSKILRSCTNKKFLFFIFSSPYYYQRHNHHKNMYLSLVFWVCRRIFLWVKNLPEYIINVLCFVYPHFLHTRRTWSLKIPRFCVCSSGAKKSGP